MNIWKFKKYITFWELLVLRCLSPFAWMLVIAGAMMLFNHICFVVGILIEHPQYFALCQAEGIPGSLLILSLGILSLWHTHCVANRVVEKAAADEAADEENNE